MIRLLFLLLLIALAVAAVRRLLLPPTDRRGSPSTQRLVQCAHCGVYVTEDSAVRDGGRSYCSEQHRQASRHGDDADV